MIGQLAERTGMSVRTLRFYADAACCPRLGDPPRDTGYSVPMRSLAPG